MTTHQPTDDRPLPEGLHPDTLALRVSIPRSAYGEHSEALYLTSSFVQPSAEEAVLRFASPDEGYTYTRTANPGNTAFELRLAALEGAERVGIGPVHAPVAEEIPPEQKAIMAKPIAELNLSVRARKCMSKLNLQTVGDLLARTGDELLECKNFGVTSLNEVREKLSALGLKLRND